MFTHGPGHGAHMTKGKKPMSISGEAEGRRFTVEELPANVLDVDPGVQRRVNMHRVKLLADAFDESALGIFTVSARRPGPIAGSGEVTAEDRKIRYVVLDGQTRLEALRVFTGSPDTSFKVLCQVYHGLTRAEEAEIFLSHNNRAAVRTVDKFRIALTAGEDWAVRLNRIVTRHGFEAGVNPTPARRFTAVTAAMKIMNLPDGEDSLDRAFDLVVRAWGHRQNAASAEAIGGIGALYHRHGAAIDTASFAKRLARKDTPQTFRSNTIANQGARRLSRTEAAYYYALSVYNLGLKSNRLEPRDVRS